MARKVGNSIYVAIEGRKDERALLHYLQTIYDPEKTVGLTTNYPNCGANPVEIINHAITNIENYGYEKAFAIVDNDVPLSVSRIATNFCIKIKKMWDTTEHIHPGLTVAQLSALRPNGAIPVIIVSEPLCFEDFIFRISKLRKPSLKNLTDSQKVVKLKEHFKSYMIKNYQSKIDRNKQNYTFNAMLDFLNEKVPIETLEVELQTNKELLELVIALKGNFQI